MLYYLGIALQGFFVYHCITNRNSYYWIFAIIFLPVIGALLYLFMNVFNKKDIDKVQEGFTAVVNPTKKITDLEKKLKFSNTFENQVALAEAYLDNEMFDKAIENYKAALKDVFKNDFYVLSKLEEAYYFSSKWNEAIEIAEKIKNNPKFRKSRASFLYGMATEKLGDIEKAEIILRQFDAPYCNYLERLELGKFLIRNAKLADAKLVLKEMEEESEKMSKPNFKYNKLLFKKVKELLDSIQ